MWRSLKNIKSVNSTAQSSRFVSSSPVSESIIQYIPGLDSSKIPDNSPLLTSLLAQALPNTNTTEPTPALPHLPTLRRPLPFHLDTPFLSPWVPISDSCLQNLLQNPHNWPVINHEPAARGSAARSAAAPHSGASRFRAVEHEPGHVVLGKNHMSGFEVKARAHCVGVAGLGYDLPPSVHVVEVVEPGIVLAEAVDLPGSLTYQVLDTVLQRVPVDLPGMTQEEMLCMLKERGHRDSFMRNKRFVALNKNAFEAKMKTTSGRRLYANKLCKGRWFLAHGVCLKDLDPEYPKNFKLFFVDRKVI